MPSVNQQVIADHLGISATTVSRCFTNHKGINPITRAKVFELASKLGYQHMELRAPTRRQTRIIIKRNVAVLICTDLDDYFRDDYQNPGAELYAGISEYAQVHDIRLSLHCVSSKDNTLDAPSYCGIDLLSRRSADGLILIYPFPRNVVRDLQSTFPIVSLVEQYGTASLDCVDVDHGKGIALLLDQLAAQGHRRIGFYAKTYEVEAQWSMRRFGAFIEKMASLDLPVAEEDVINVYPRRYMTLEQSFFHAHARIQSGTTAWVCAADHQAYDLIAFLEQQGMRVPKDVSVTGFDGIDKPAHARLLLTTAAIPYREIGYAGTRRLSTLLVKRFGSPQHVLVAPQLRDGETVGPPRC